MTSAAVAAEWSAPANWMGADLPPLGLDFGKWSCVIGRTQLDFPKSSPVVRQLDHWLPQPGQRMDPDLEALPQPASGGQ